MSIRVTITKPNVTDAYGLPMVVGSTYTVNDDFGLSLIQQGKASDTDSSLTNPGVREADPLNVLYCNAATIAAPTAQMLASYNTVFILDVAPFTRYRSNGTYLVPEAQYATDSSGSILGLSAYAVASPGAKFLFGAASASVAGDEIFNVTRVDTNAGALTRPLMSLFEHAVAPASAPGVTTDFHCIDARLYGSSANIDSTTRFYCIEGKTTCQKSSGSMARTVGVMGSSVMTGAGTVDLSVAVQTDVQNTGSGTVTEGVGLYIPNGVNSGGGTLTTLYGIKIENQTSGSTNYSIYTSQGRVRFFGGTAIPAGGTAGVGVTFSSTSNFGVFFGSGAPTLAAAKGSLYLRSDGSTTNDRAYINTNGGSTWTALTTVA